MIDDPHLQDMLSGSPEHRPGQSEATDAVAMEIEAELAEAMGSLNVVSARVVALVARSIEGDCWDQGGIRSPSHDVTWQCGLSPARARQVLRLAVGLARLPVTRAAFEAGELTADQADVVVRWTPPAHDAEACELARQLTVPQLRRAMPALSPPDPSPQEAEAGRRVSFGASTDGSEWRLSARLPIDEGATAEAALRAARDRGDSWADALVKIFEAGLDDADRPQPSTDGQGAVLRGGDDWNDPPAAGPPDETSTGTGAPRPRAGSGSPEGNDPDGAAQPASHPGDGLRLPGLDDPNDAEGGGPCPTCGIEPDTGPTPGRVRHRIWFHLETDARGNPMLSAHPGTPLPQAIARDLCCDGIISPVSAFGVGRSQRIVPDRTRRKVEHRDKGCRYPGCHLNQVQVHHIIHWLDLGETEPENLLCLCARHHRLHHLGAYEIAGNPQDPTGLRFTRPDGKIISPRPPPKPPPGGYPATPRSDTWAHPTGETLNLYWITPPTGADPPGQLGEAA